MLCIGVAAVALDAAENVAPKNALSNYLRKEAGASTITAPDKFLTPSPSMRRLAGTAQLLSQPKICAIPLLEVPGLRTNDRLTHPGLEPFIDPKMARPLGIPACARR